MNRNRILLAVGALSLLTIITGTAFYWRQEDPRHIYERGLKAVADSDWDEVLQCTKTLNGMPEWKAHARLLEGFSLKNAGQIEQAFVIFSEANSHPETREQSYHQAAQILYDSRQYQQAVLLLRQVLEWNPDRTESYRLLASAWYDLGAMEQAIISLDQVIRLEPNDFRPHYMKATILRDFERFEDASIAFKEAVNRAPAGKPVADEIRSAWGDCLIRLRKYEDALRVLEPAGDWAEVLAWRSQACFSLRRFDDAQKLADQALSKEPLQPEALLVAAMTRERSGDAQTAIQILEDGLKKYPNELRYHHRLADFHGAVGNVETATRHRNRAGEIADLRSKFSAAHQAMVRDTSTAVKRLELARLAEALGEAEMARSWFFAALSLAPEDADIRTAWQQFLEAHPEQSPANSVRPLPRPAGAKSATPASPSEF